MNGRVRHTACVLCDLDIEGYLYGYGSTLKIGRDWRDRGNNQTCAATGAQHVPAITDEDRRRPAIIRTRSKKLVPRARTSSTAKYREGCAALALEYALKALHYAKAAGAPYSAERLQLAVSSLRGAVRNAENRRTRELMRGAGEGAKGGDRAPEG